MRRFNWREPKHQILLIILGGFVLYIYYMVRLGGFALLDFIYTFYGVIFFQSNLINPNVLALGIDILVFGIGGLVFWAAFFGQFVLPVRTVQERKLVVERLLSTLGVSAGPAILVQNGQIIDHSTERQRRGAGVILLDTASAAVLHNSSSFTRAVGPGLVFTNRFESIFSAVDLHTQIRRIGPMDDDGDPETASASPEDKAAWRERRLQTSGLTRDGVEVIPQITAVFRLRAEPGEGNTRFGYRQESVWRAVAHQGIDPDAPPEPAARQVAWDWLPVQMAADLWREYLRKYTFDELFEFPTHPVHSPDGRTEPYPRRTVFETIVHQMNARLSQDLVAELDEVGKPTGRTLSSREHLLVLQRGLKIIHVSVGNLRFSKDPIEKSLIDRWINTWLIRAREEERLINQQQAIEKARGQHIAREEFAGRVSRALYRRILPRPETAIPEPTLAETLELLLQGTLEGLHTSPELLPHLGDVEAELNDMKEWLRQNRNGTGEAAPSEPQL